MPNVYQIAIRTTRGKERGRYKVTLTAKEGTYALSVPQTVFGKFMYQIVKQKPLTIEFGRKNPISVNINFKGIRPLGKTARKVLKYTPLRPPRPKDETPATTPPQKSKEKPTTPLPKIPEITSAVFEGSEQAKGGRKGTKKNTDTKGGKKRAVATAA